MSTMPDSNMKSETWLPAGPRRLSMVAAVIVLVSGCFLVFQALGLRRCIVESWLEAVEQRSGIQLKMAAFTWSWPFRLIIDGAEMHLHGKRLLQCDRMTVTFSPLWRRPFWYVRALALDHPVFYLERDNSGRWSSSSPASNKPDAATISRRGDSSRDSLLSITIRVSSGAIVAEQDGHRVLRVGNVSGQLTLPFDGGIGMDMLLVNLEQLRPTVPRAFTLRGGNAGLREGAAP